MFLFLSLSLYTVSLSHPLSRINEGSEHILFREKFSDWPEQGRIIKMKGHSTAPVVSPTVLCVVDVVTSTPFM